MPPADFCFNVVPEDEDEEEDECDGLLAGWLDGDGEEPPQAVTSAMTAPNMIVISRRDVILAPVALSISSRTVHGSRRDLVQRRLATTVRGQAAGRGGLRYLPWIFRVRGAVRNGRGAGVQQGRRPVLLSSARCTSPRWTGSGS
jgi:hypothetical protein